MKYIILSLAFLLLSCPSYAFYQQPITDDSTGSFAVYQYCSGLTTSTNAKKGSTSVQLTKGSSNSNFSFTITPSVTNLSSDNNLNFWVYSPSEHLNTTFTLMLYETYIGDADKLPLVKARVFDLVSGWNRVGIPYNEAPAGAGYSSSANIQLMYIELNPGTLTTENYLFDKFYITDVYVWKTGDTFASVTINAAFDEGISFLVSGNADLVIGTLEGGDFTATHFYGNVSGTFNIPAAGIYNNNWGWPSGKYTTCVAGTYSTTNTTVTDIWRFTASTLNSAYIPLDFPVGTTISSIIVNGVDESTSSGSMRVVSQRGSSTYTTLLFTSTLNVNTRYTINAPVAEDKSYGIQIYAGSTQAVADQIYIYSVSVTYTSSDALFRRKLYGY